VTSRPDTGDGAVSTGGTPPGHPPHPASAACGALPRSSPPREPRPASRARALLPILALALAIVAWAPLSRIALAAYSHHDCIGDDCPICQVMDAIAHASGQQADVAHALVPLPHPAPVAEALTPATRGTHRIDTPISLKVRLDT
jgi:hypothetical protein